MISTETGISNKLRTSNANLNTKSIESFQQSILSISSTTNESDGESVSTEGGAGQTDLACMEYVSKKNKRKKSKNKLNAPFFKSKVHFKCTNYLKEDHAQPIFSVIFNEFIGNNHPSVFATVGSNQISIYECDTNSAAVNLLMAYVDADSDENFFTCAWSFDDVTGYSVLAAAGARGIIRVLRPCTNSQTKVYSGHGQAINELRFSPTDPNLMLSAGKDHSMRLWNIKTDICIVIFGGIEGHRDELISADFNIDGQMIVSCGMDHSLKIWKLDNESVKESICNSYNQSFKTRKTFKTFAQHYPDFSTRDIHSNYVDCVRWWGKLIFSKSCDNKIVCWKPSKLPTLDYEFVRSSEGHSTTILHEFELSNCDIWFMRFSLNPGEKLLALGNQVGKIYVWNLDANDLNDIKCVILSHNKCTTPVRQTSFSKDGQILIAVCDDGTIWRWDRDDIPGS